MSQINDTDEANKPEYMSYNNAIITGAVVCGLFALLVTVCYCVQRNRSNARERAEQRAALHAVMQENPTCSDRL